VISEKTRVASIVGQEKMGDVGSTYSLRYSVAVFMLMYIRCSHAGCSHLLAESGISLGERKFSLLYFRCSRYFLERRNFIRIVYEF
jgi:hypothetical protein